MGWIGLPVHPRACGEQRSPGQHCEHCSGSSPRLRGTGSDTINRLPTIRFVPAPAGNRNGHRYRHRPRQVHPRACGEQKNRQGNHHLAVGSSPRLRGTDHHGWTGQLQHRFIPAPAGNRDDREARLLARPVHPRACGEQCGVIGLALGQLGSSPRLRGTVSLWPSSLPGCRFIPAPAGNSCRAASCRPCGPVHPRACGEQFNHGSPNQSSDGSSPRLRGTEQSPSNQRRSARFIPAPAGNRVVRPFG